MENEITEKIYGILVVYNRNVEQSQAYCCLKKYKNVDLIICDNSTKDYANKHPVEQDGYTYLNMHGNVGLSKAYNRAIDKINELNPRYRGYIVLLDDDTFIPEDYFFELSAAIKKHNSHIFLPIVEDEIGILSPSIMKKYYCHRAIGDVHCIKKRELCGINSGMAIRKDLFDNYRYNENIFLDYVDHNFIRDMRKKDVEITILDVVLRQKFSSNSDSKEKALIRFSIFKKDINEFYKHGFWNRFFYYYTIVRRKTRLAMQFKDFKLLFI